MVQRLEVWRGAACLCLVAFHVIGQGRSGLHVSDGLLRYTSDWLALIRMPMFALLSGWFYTWRPMAPGGGRGLIARKAHRLLVPMVTVGSLFLVTQAIVPGTNSKPQSFSLLEPFAHFWFLQALFLIFILLVLLETIGALASLRRWATLLAAAAILSIINPAVPIGGLHGTLYLLPYFLLGVGMGRFKLVPTAERHGWLLWLFLPPALAVYMSHGSGSGWTHDGARVLLSLVLLLALITLRVRNRPLQWLADHSYAIFLFHVFFTAGIRIVLHRLGIEPLAVHVPLGIAAGLAGPVLVSMLARRHPLSNSLLLGASWPIRPTLWLRERLRQATAASGTSTSPASRRT